MTPLHLRILLHYHATAANFTSPIHHTGSEAAAQDYLIDQLLLESFAQSFRVTEKGRALISAACDAVVLPKAPVLRDALGDHPNDEYEYATVMGVHTYADGRRALILYQPGQKDMLLPEDLYPDWLHFKSKFRVRRRVSSYHAQGSGWMKIEDPINQMCDDISKVAKETLDSLRKPAFVPVESDVATTHRLLGEIRDLLKAIRSDL